MKMRAVGWALATTAALTPVLAWANGGREGYYGHGQMWGGGWGHWVAGPVMMILVIAAIIAIVVLVVRWMGGPAAGGTQGPAQKTPVDILKERYARGEIDSKEFEERRKALGE